MPPELNERFAPFEGKYIQVEVLSGRQPISPGPAFIDTVGQIKEMEQPAIEVEFRTSPETDGNDAQKVELLLIFKNRSTREVELDGKSVAYGFVVVEEQKGRDFAKLLGYPYTSSQLVEPNLWQPFEFIHYGDGAKLYSHIGKIRLRPAESAAFVWAALPLPAGRYELGARAIYRHGDAHQPINAWKPLDLPLANNSAKRAPLRAESSVEYDGEWIVAKGRFFTPDSKPRRLLVHPHPQRDVLPGNIKLIDPTGRVMPTVAQEVYPDGPWIEKVIGPEGLPFEVKVRPHEAFSATSPSMLQLDLVTSAGLERIELVKDLSSRPQFVLPKWGEAVDGVRCRVRMAKDRFTTREPVRLLIQADAEQGKAQMFHTTKEPLILDLDGKQATLRTSIPGGYVLSFPYEASVEVSQEKPLAIGRHRLQITLTADGPEFEGTKLKFRSFRGRLISNVVDFEIVQ